MGMTDDLKADRDKCKSRLEDLRSYRDKYDSIKKKKSECDNQIDDLKKEIEGLKSTAQRKSIEHEESLKEIDLKNKVLSSQVDLLKKDIDVESKKCRKLEVSQEQEKLVINNLEQRISKITEERTELMKQLQNQM